MSADSLVIGAGGLLGRAVSAELTRRDRQFESVAVPWTDEVAAAGVLDQALRSISAGAVSAQLWWCAGAGVTSTSPEQLAAELRLLERFADSVESVASSGCKLSVFFASSAGGVYAGSQAPPFTENSEPRPLSPYGAAKLQAEEMFAALSASGVRVAIARIANIYGPGQDLRKPQGLISQLCLAAELGRPLNIYVSMDTLRDYVYVADAAAMCVDFCDTVAAGDAGAVIKIVSTGRSVTVGGLIGETNRIFRKRAPVVMAASPMGRQQARDLRLRSLVLPELDRRPMRTLGSGMSMVRRAVEEQLRRGKFEQSST